MKEAKAKSINAFDVVKDKKEYKLVNIEYDLETMEAKVISVEVLPGSKHNARMNVEQILIQKFKRFR